jgi:hypothetical protein
VSVRVWENHPFPFLQCSFHREKFITGKRVY